MEKVLEHVSENLSVEIFPDDKFEFLITTNEAAKGFGINPVQDTWTFTTVPA